MSICYRLVYSCPHDITRFHTDPSGTFVRYDAKAVGSGSEAAQSELQDKWHKVRSLDLIRFPYLKSISFQQMTLKEAHILTLRVLKQVMEEKLDHHNVQLAQVSVIVLSDGLSYMVDRAVQVTTEKGFEILDEVRLKELIDDM